MAKNIIARQFAVSTLRPSPTKCGCVEADGRRQEIGPRRDCMQELVTSVTKEMLATVPLFSRLDDGTRESIPLLAKVITYARATC